MMLHSRYVGLAEALAPWVNLEPEWLQPVLDLHARAPFVMSVANLFELFFRDALTGYAESQASLQEDWRMSLVRRTERSSCDEIR